MSNTVCRRKKLSKVPNFNYFTDLKQVLYYVDAISSAGDNSVKVGN